MEENKVVTLLDENDQEKKFEVIMDFNVNDNEYAALLPLDDDAEEGVLLFRVIEEKGDLRFEGIPDKEEYDIVADAFNELI